MSGGIFLGNKILDISIVAAFIAQFWKVINPIFKGKKPRWDRMWQTGGMPSSHSASVTSLATSVGILNGHRSVEFAIAVVFSIIIMYDAAGVRRAAGKQAGVLNRLIHSLGKKDNSIKIEVELKELIGHTPFEVLVGAVLGFFVAFLLMK